MVGRGPYQRHRWRSEGYHGEAKTWHALSRAIRRGLINVKILANLTAAAVNGSEFTSTAILQWTDWNANRFDHLLEQGYAPEATVLTRSSGL